MAHFERYGEAGVLTAKEKFQFVRAKMLMPKCPEKCEGKIDEPVREPRPPAAKTESKECNITATESREKRESEAKAEMKVSTSTELSTELSTDTDICITPSGFALTNKKVGKISNSNI